MAVVSRQTGVLNLSGTSATATVTAVNTAKSILKVTAKTTASGGNMSEGLVTATLTNSTTITAKRAGTSAPSVDIYWELIEFDDSDLSVQRGDYTAAYETQDLAISSVSLSRASANLMKARIGTAWRERGTSAIDLTSSTNVRLLAPTGQTANTSTTWEVVEWPAAASVQAGLTTLSGTATSGTGVLSSIDTAESFIDFTCVYLSTDNPNDNIWSVGAVLTSSTAATFTREAGLSGGGVSDVHWFVITWPAISVQRGVVTWTADETSQDVALTTVDPAKCLTLTGGTPSQVSGRALSASAGPDTQHVATTLTASQISLSRFVGGGENVEIPWAVVEFDVGGATYAELAGTPSGAGAASGDLTGVSDLAASAPGAATASADLVGVSDLSASAAGAGAASADLTLAAALDGSAAGAGTATGNLTGVSDLAASASGAATASGNLTGDAALSGTAAGAGAATADLNIGGGIEELAGTAAGAGTASANLTGTSDLSAAASGAGTATGALTGTSDLAASASAAGTATADLTGASDLAATANGAATATGNLITFVDLSGAAAGAATAAGNLTGISALTGVAAGAGTLAGDLGLIVGLSGAAAGLATVVANLLASSPQTSAIRGATGASGGASYTRTFGTNGSRGTSGTTGRTRADG